MPLRFTRPPPWSPPISRRFADVARAPDSRRTYTVTFTFKVTEGPKWFSHFEITRDNDTITILGMKRNGYAQAEAEIPAADFFKMIDKLKDY